MSDRLAGRTAVITGASAGIGAALARRLAARGTHLHLLARRAGRLEALADELRTGHGVRATTHGIDLLDLDALRAFWRNLPAVPDIVVNNAGMAAGADPVVLADPADWDLMMRTNVAALMELSRLAAVDFAARGGGHILNVGSIAGHDPYPGGSGYNASKFAVDGFTRALKMEMIQHGVRVSLISPGMVETEFSEVRFKGDRERAATVYKGIEALTAEDVAEIMEFILDRPPHVDILDVVVHPTQQASPYHVHRS